MARLWYLIKRLRAQGPLPAVVVLLALTTAATAVSADSYTMWPGDFMRMGAGARAMGMGNAYAAVHGDIYGAYYNPASLAFMRDTQVSFSMRYMSMDRKFRDLLAGGDVGPDAAVAFGWINAGTDDIIGRDLNGNATGSLTDSRNLFSVSFGKGIFDWLSIGLNTKLALWKLDDDDARSFGFDAGVLVLPMENLSAALVIHDLNSGFTWNSKRWNTHISDADGQPLEKEDDLPLYVTGGLAYRMFEERLLVSGGFEYVEDNPLGLDLGAEYAYNDRFTFRTGLYNYTTDTEYTDHALTAGFTVGVAGSLHLDYAYTVDDSVNDTVHILALVLGDGE